MEIKMLDTVHKLEPNQMGILFGNGTFVLLFTRMSGNADSQKMRERFINAANLYTFFTYFEIDADEHQEVAAKYGMTDGYGYVVFEKGEIIYMQPGALSFDGLNSMLWHLRYRQINGIIGDYILDVELDAPDRTGVIRKMSAENLQGFLWKMPSNVILFTQSNPDENMMRMEAVVESTASLFPRIQFCTVEADVMQSLAINFKISKLPTCIGYKNGLLSLHVVGAKSEEQFHDLLRKFLAETQIPDS